MRRNTAQANRMSFTEWTESPSCLQLWDTWFSSRQPMRLCSVLTTFDQKKKKTSRYASFSVVKCKNRMGLGAALHFENSSAGFVLDARAVNVTACVRRRAEAAVIRATWEKFTERSKQERDIQITAGTDHCDVTMPTTHCGIFTEG